jgi:arginase
MSTEHVGDAKVSSVNSGGSKTRAGLQLIAVPFHSAQRAVAMGRGPLVLVEHGLIERLNGHGYDVGLVEIEEPDLQHREIARTFEIDRRIAHAARAAINAGRLPIVIAGNCNSSLGTTAAIEIRRVGVLWFDAHADFDVPDDNLSGFFDVMALSTLTGSCWTTLRRTIPGFREVAEHDVLLVGARDLEPYQRERLDRSSIRVAYGGESEQLALEQSALSQLNTMTRSIETLYVHIDLDCLDDSCGRANEYAAPHGLKLEQVRQIVAAARALCPVGAIAFTAYDPTLDAAGEFAAVAVGLIEEVVCAAVPGG